MTITTAPAAQRVLTHADLAARWAVATQDADARWQDYADAMGKHWLDDDTRRSVRRDLLDALSIQAHAYQAMQQ